MDGTKVLKNQLMLIRYSN